VIRCATGTFELDDDFSLLIYLVLLGCNLCFYFFQVFLNCSAIHRNFHNTDMVIDRPSSL